MTIAAGEATITSHKRFIARSEHFGALVYDRERGDYIPFDTDATALFDGSRKQSIHELFPQFEDRLSRQSFDTFVQLCRSIELIDEKGRFTGEFVVPHPAKGMLSAPLRVHLAVTNQCLMNCRHCSQDTRDPLPNELTTEEIQKLLDELAAMGTCQVVIAGGEPFLRPDLLAIVRHARHRGLSVSLSTTATSVNRVHAKKLAELGIKSIRISLDGAAEKSYDYYRGVKGAYRKAMRGIKTLRDIFEKVPITLHSTLMKPNVSEILALSRLVEKLRLETWSIDFVKPVGYGAEAPNLWLSKEEGDELFRKIGKMTETMSVPLKMAHFPYKGQVQGSRQFGYTCVGGNLFAYVSPNGSVAPCSFTCRQFPAGNIRRKPLREIWLDSDMLRKFRQGVATAQACAFCMRAASANVPNVRYESNAFVMQTATADV